MTPRHRTVAGFIAAMVVAGGLGAACGGASASTGSGSGSATAKPADASTLVDVTLWSTSFCNDVGTYQASTTAEFASFATAFAPGSTSNPASITASLKNLELGHLDKVLQILATVMNDLKTQGVPNISGGPGFVAGYLSAFGALQTSIEGAIDATNAVASSQSPSSARSGLNAVNQSVDADLASFAASAKRNETSLAGAANSTLVSAMDGAAGCVSFTDGLAPPSSTSPTTSGS